MQASEIVAEVQARRKVLGRKFEADDVDEELTDLVTEWLRDYYLDPSQSEFLTSCKYRIETDRELTPGQVKGVANWIAATKAAQKHTSFPLVPSGRYAVRRPNGADDIIQIDRPEKGRWFGYTFVSRLHGSHPDFRHEQIRGAEALELAQYVARDPYAAAARFGELTGHCFRCGAGLTDPESVERGMGPDCAKYVEGVLV